MINFSAQAHNDKSHSRFIFTSGTKMTPVDWESFCTYAKGRGVALPWDWGYISINSGLKPMLQACPCAGFSSGTN